MKRALKILALPLVGLLTMITGFVYFVTFAGLPYPDPTPELQAEWKYDENISWIILKIGGFVLFVGLLAIPFLLKKTRPRSLTK
jgi:predicted MFS family arabinose efflux permease